MRNRTNAKHHISAEQARDLLRYEAETGLLFWRERGREHCASDHECQRWNTRFAGKQALTAVEGGGYPFGTVLGLRCKAHRIIWLMQTGHWPEGEIDHINGVPSDNRWINLREVSHVQNLRNKSQQANNTSGVNGVYWSKRHCKWRAMISVDGKLISLGYFSTVDEAAIARSVANDQYGFTARHGT
jgi:hypothetical protein